jgi:N-acetylglucosaminyldiphosphoundecaprenol N-acetyl-beta-D-mannosaminyltransferase
MTTDLQTGRRIRLLGAEMDAVTRAEVFAFTAGRVAARRKALVANHNLHSLALLPRTPEMARFYALADLVEIDSMPLVAWGRLLGRRVGREHRNTYLDFREDFWRLAAEKGWRVFHVGCRPGVGAKAVEALSARWPGVTFGERDGYFDMAGAENAALLDQLAAFGPDILFVGMGMPRQERWILDNWERLPACVVFPIGAAFDYEAGVVPTPPRWAGRLGLEWLARFLAEPGRLFHRYFVEPWALVPAMLRDLAGR